MNNKVKLGVGVVLTCITILSILITASSILKEEAVENYLTISKLNAKSFAKELNQDISNIEQTIKNISSILNFYDLDTDINSRLADIQENYPQIRSINVSQNDMIKYSSNQYNMGLIINDSNFFSNTYI